MAVPSIALSVCPGPHQLNSYTSYDFDINGGRSTSSAAASPSQKPFVGGLSYLFPSQPVKSACYSTAADDLGSLWHDRNGEELGSPYRFSSSLKRDHAHQSPVSVFQGPSSSIGPSPKGSPMRIGADFSSMRTRTAGMFDGFVTHALGSSVEYDSLALDVDSDDLTFRMEDSFCIGMDLPPYARDLLTDAQSRHVIFTDDFVVNAFREAEKAHRGQNRASGHPYLQHCVETAVLLAKVGANSTVVAAGLLHDSIDDSSITLDHISRSVGAGVADLVEGVSKLSHLSKLARENNTASKTAEADRLHTMFLAMADARAVLIKLADRLHNMMTLDALPLIKQQRFAKETLEIFAPLANRLGICTWKEQLENLCFKHLNPDQHQQLSSELVDSFDEGLVTSSVEKLEQALKAGAVSYHSVSGRNKSLYSIYTKMLKKKLDMDKIHDIHGLRLIVESEEDCYKALRVMQQLWSEVPGRFKDYIRDPKFNGYQSLHTVVMGEGMVPLEVQIRTKEMHLQAECGFAAHWLYKEGDCKYSSFVLQMVEWARWVISWPQCEAMRKDGPSNGSVDSTTQPCKFPKHSGDCTFSCNHCDSDGPVFVIMIENDKMSVQEFPGNSSVMDLLVRAGRSSSRWTGYGFPVKEELRPRLNYKPVTDPTCRLKMGDVVELTPAIPDKSLTSYREEIQRMYNRGVTKPSVGTSTTTMASSRS